MADEELRFRATGEDAGAGRMFDKLGDAAEDTADDVKHLDRQLDKLDERLDVTKSHIAGLIAEFRKTGDMDLLKQFRKDRGLLRQLEAMQEPVRAGLLSSMRETLGSLPAEVKGAAIVGAAGVGALVAPLVGAAVGTAVLGGVGAGGIIGGIALAAQDSRVEDAAGDLGRRFMSHLTDEAQPFIRPLVLSMRELEEPLFGIAEMAGRGFAKLAPLTSTIARNLAKAQDALEPGYDVALEAAVPVVRALANEIPEIAEAASDFMSYVGSDPDGAIMALSTISEILQSQLRFWGRVIQGAEGAYEWILRTAQASREATPDFLEWVSPLAGAASALGALGDTAETDLERARAAAETYVGAMTRVETSTDRAREATVAFAESLEDQFDPSLNLIHRLEDLRTAQREYNTAVREHGADSREARDAELELASAILRAGSAAAAASGTFDGKLSTALRRILTDGGMTEEQIRDVEKQFAAAQRAGERFARTYTAKAQIEFFDYRSGERNPSGRASGGPVSAGQTYMVGEKGPELITMPRDGYVHDAVTTRGMMAGSRGGSVSTSGSTVGAVVGLGMREPDSALGRALAAWIVPYIQVEVMNLGGDADTVLSAPRR